MYWFYTSVDYKLDVFGANITWTKRKPTNKQTNKPTFIIKIKHKQNKTKTWKEKQGPRQIQDQDLLQNFLKKKFIYLNSM